MKTPPAFFSVLALTLASFAADDLGGVSRQADAYNTWKLALTAGTATDPAAITAPAGFRVELLRSALPEEDSWIAMAFDPEGRLTIAREKKGLLRITPGTMSVETIEDTLLECRGLLYAYGSLYVVANNSKVFVRLRDTDGDGHFDETKELLRTGGGTGHGRNHVKLGPDGMIYLVHGNNVVAPPEAAPDSPLRNFHDDRLIPCPWDAQMFDGDVPLPAGHILRTDRDGTSFTLLAGGLRNALDVAFNEDGEMFTFDADMEWDTGTPWYRPCRVNHILSGADYGWRRGTSKWPAYFPDCGPTVLDIGLASPTGIEFGTRSHFPARWRRALFICDWSYGRIVAVHLRANGASYTGTAEPFVVGKPLNVTDFAFGPDGAMYFITGGRRTQSGLYRVSYTGPKVEDAPEPAGAEARALRRRLEALPENLEEIWPHLGSADPSIRHAARIALERLSVAQWQPRALAEKDTLASLTALLALARCGGKDALAPMLARLDALPFASLDAEQQILAARDYQLAFIRLGAPDPACARRLEALYPAADWRVSHLLCELLVHLQSPGVLGKTVALIEQSTRSEDLLHYLFFLRNVNDGWTLDLRRACLAAINRAEMLEGARDYQRSLKMIRSEMVEKLTPSEREAVAPLLATFAPPPPSSGPQILVRVWKIEELLPALDRVGHGRSLDAGRQAFAGAQCVLCHRVGAMGGLAGPDLTAIASRFSRRDILDSILNPSRVIDEKYRNTLFTLKDGTSAAGTVEREDETFVHIRASPLSTETTPLRKSDIARRELSPISPMPPGLLDTMTQNQILDLLAYLESGGKP